MANEVNVPQLNAAGDLEYKFRADLFGELPSGQACITDFEPYYDEFMDAGRSTNAKKSVLKDIFDDGQFNLTDEYCVLRRWAGSNFPHPERTTDLPSSAKEDAVREFVESHTDLDYDSRREEYRSPNQLLREEPIDTDGDMKLTEAYDYRYRLSETGSEAKQKEIIVEALEEAGCAWVVLQFLDGGMTHWFGSAYALQVFADYHGYDESDVREAYGFYNDAGYLHVEMSEGGLLDEIEPHIPHSTMKAQSYEPEQVFDETDSAIDNEQWIAETKYDGVRLFVHHSGDGDVRAYLNGMRDVTAVLPELDELDLPDCSFIFDCEATPYDSDGNVLDFSNIIRRVGRKHSAGSTDEVEVQFKFFDCPYWQGEDITDRPYTDRRCIVDNVFPPMHTARKGVDIEETFMNSIDSGHEGLVIKKKSNHYAPHRRSGDWRKIKPNPDTLDVEIVGAYEGAGTNTGSLGGVEIAVKHPKGDLVTVGHCGGGFSNAERDRLYREYEAGKLEGKVIEVEYEGVQFNTESMSLRFPRFVSERPEGDVDSAKKLVDEDTQDSILSWLGLIDDDPFR
jgi:ATP-dependent DNA ligase